MLNVLLVVLEAAAVLFAVLWSVEYAIRFVRGVRELATGPTWSPTTLRLFHRLRHPHP
jgi:hypothetical protein